MKSIFNRRHSLRLQGYDYAQPGAYFVTMVTHQREHLFGQVLEGIIQLNLFGNIARDVLIVLPQHYPWISVDYYVIMPNHVHTVIIINEPSDGSGRGGSANVLSKHPGNNLGSLKTLERDMETRPYTYRQDSIPSKVIHIGLPEIIRAYKSFSARRINYLRGNPGRPVWQRSYYDHIIRNEIEMGKIRDYIETNPQTWDADTLHS